MGKGIAKYLKYVFQCFIDIIYASDMLCTACDAELTEDKLICFKCEKSIMYCNEPMIIGTGRKKFICYSVTYYSNTIKNIVIKFKYRNEFRCGELLAKLMCDFLKKNNLEFDVITFVPSGKESYKKRGYNQCEYMANLLGDYFNKKVIDCITKTKETKIQKTLNTDKRWENLKNSFEIISNEHIKNKNVLLIDDVVTTGATVYYCAEKLLDNKANNVIILTAAKSKI